MANRALITGATGFLGKKILEKLNKLGWAVVTWNVDVRDLDIKERVDYVFHFGSPSSQVLFARNPEYCIGSTINGLLKVVDYSRKVGAKLIYPSTGHIKYDNDYARCKLLSEKIVTNSGIESLGVRIYAGYGPGEEHKRDYKSPIGLFLDDIENYRQPIVFGDGNQRRDFVYIDDIVDNLVDKALNVNGIDYIGTGISYTFNEVILLINKIVHKQKSLYIKPIYVDKPQNYVEETLCDRPIKNYTPLKEGIQRYYESHRHNHNS